MQASLQDSKNILESEVNYSSSCMVHVIESSGKDNMLEMMFVLTFDIQQGF
jgi:hypothetical protein